MKNHPQTTQIILSILFFLVCFSGFLFLYHRIATKEKVAEDGLMTWRIEAARRDEIQTLDSSMKKIEGEKEMLETHFAQSSNPVPFLDTLEKLAKSVGATNTVSSVDVPKDGKSLVVGMSATGSFESFYKFLTLLENSPYDLEFISVNIQKDGGTDAAGTAGSWTASIRLRLLSFIK